MAVPVCIGDRVVRSVHNWTSPGVSNGAPDGLSRLVATDISVDGRRSPSDEQPTNLWEDCLFVGCDPNVVADAAADLLRDDPAWADWQPVGNMRDVMHSVLVAQLNARQACALPPQVLETLNVVCEAENPEWAWPSGFRIGGITALLPESPLVIPVPLESTAQAILEALVMADVGVRDNFPDFCDGGFANLVAPISERPIIPDDVADSLPSLAAMQRADPVWSEVFSLLETPTGEQRESWTKKQFVAAGTAAKPEVTMTLLEIAALCWIDSAGILQRHRTNVHGARSVRIPKDPEDRGVICVPASLSLAVLSLHHGGSEHTGRGRLYESLHRTRPAMWSSAIFARQ